MGGVFMLTLFAFAIIFILFTLGYLGIDKLEHYFKTLNKWLLYFDHAVPDPYMGLYVFTKNTTTTSAKPSTTIVE